jgi:hypothetical protein
MFLLVFILSHVKTGARLSKDSLVLVIHNVKYGLNHDVFSGKSKTKIDCYRRTKAAIKTDSVCVAPAAQTFLSGTGTAIQRP